MKKTWLLSLAVGWCGLVQLGAQGTAFTYQGQLVDQGAPANGSYDLVFELRDSLTGGGPINQAVTNAAVAVNNGVFTVTLDFGAGAFNGNARWLQVGVRSNGTAGGFTTLTPRQPVTPTPYAILAGGISGILPDSQLSPNVARLDANQNFTGAVTFNPASGSPLQVGSTNRVSNLNADLLDGLDSGGFWRAVGNTGTTPGTNFIGTTDNQALEFKINNSRALRLEPTATSPNFIAGSFANLVSNNMGGAVISGGGSAANPNRVGGSYSTIGGGYNNLAYFGSATVGGGDNNTAAQDRATVGGGYSNLASGLLSTVGGGDQNQATGSFATVPGGRLNSATTYAFAAGTRAKATNQGSFVWADSQSADFGSTGNNQFLIRAQNGVGINLNNPTAPLDVNGKAKMTQFQLGSSATAGQLLTADANGNGTWQTAAFASRSGDTFSGDITVANPADLNFGAATRQMINLHNSNYGIGVQNNVLYQRSDTGFAWFRDGVHSNTENDPGAGGTNLMLLNANGTLTLNASLVVDGVNSNNGSFYPGIVFAPNSGETITSKRTSGGNQYGLDFWTGFINRMSITAGGNVGIGTTNPGAKLDINTGVGNIQFRNEAGLVPGINVTGGGIPGIMRFRNAMEIWPSDNAARAGYLDVRGTNGSANIVLNGANGEATVKVLTITGGADIAEPFQTSEPNEIPKGAVVVIDEENPGRLKKSRRAYDTRVAGIISGANGVNPGLALHQQGVLEGGQNVALTGRVYALADASQGAIKPGDLLTTSDVPGHVMKASDRERGHGAILGKAMTGLKEGKGMVLVLVSLQ